MDANDDLPDYGDPYLNQIAGVSDVGRDFAGRIAQLQSDLRARGVETRIISGYRSPQQQEWLVQHPQGNPVAPPGGSFHNYGAAVDIVPVGDYASGNAAIGALASDPARGLTWGGNWGGSAHDPNHIQLGGVSIDQLRGDSLPPSVSAYSAPAGTLGSYRQGIENGQSSPQKPVDTSFLKDFPVAPKQSASGAPSTDFLTDFPIAPPSSGSSSSQAAPSSSAASAQTDFLKDFPVAPKQNGAAGPDGLIWDANGGHDPQTGALVVAGKPFTKASQSQAVAATTGFLNGIPIVGPALVSGVEKAAAAAHALTSGTPYDQNVSANQDIVANSLAANPKTTIGANALGGVAGTAAGIAAAPALFGVSKAPLIVNALTSGATGAAIGGLDAGARTSGDLEAMKGGAIAGGVFGGVAPGVGKLVGSGINWLANTASRTTAAARNVANALSEVGMTPQDAQAALLRMGPQATLADVDPALTLKAGALASLGGSPTSILKTAMLQRAAGADDRVASAIDQYLGPRPDLTATQDAIEQTASAKAAPFYNAARATAQPMDVTPVLANIDAQMKNAVGGEANVLKTARSYLTDDTQTLPGPNGQPVAMPIPKDDPQALLKARQGLDDYIQKLPVAETTAGKNAASALQNVRGQLDAVLKTDPNIAAGDAAYSTQMRNLDAINEGTELFKPGTRIEDVQRSLAAKTPDQVSAMQQGALSAVHDALDTARQGDFSAARSLFGKSTANRAKLDALFPNAGNVFDTIEGEMAMRSTENTVASNSATASRLAAQKEFQAPESNALSAAVPIVGEAVGGGYGAVGAMAAKSVYNHVTNALGEASRARLTEGLANALSSTGAPQSAFMQQLERAYQTNGPTNALSGAGEAIANLVARSPGRKTLNYLAGQ